jgi:hypothetical protein
LPLLTIQAGEHGRRKPFVAAYPILVQDFTPLFGQAYTYFSAIIGVDRALN